VIGRKFGGLKMKKYIIATTAVFVIFTLALVFAAPCFAQGDVIEKMGRKLGRGIVNMATGWIEIPKTIYDVSVETNPFTGVTYGALKGAGMTVVRTGAGVYDVVTFLFPAPADYMPIFDPEFVLSR